MRYNNHYQYKEIRIPCYLYHIHFQKLFELQILLHIHYNCINHLLFLSCFLKNLQYSSQHCTKSTAVH